jgi:hypothetical protein
MTLRITLGNDLDPTRRRQPPDDPQQLGFHNGRVVRLVDRRSEPVNEVLELRVIQSLPTEAAEQPVSDTSAQAHGQTRVSAFWRRCRRKRGKLSLARPRAGSGILQLQG